MSQYSQTYGSFTRTGNYPLEANYTFSTEQELIEFYSNSVEQTHLHLGLLKIVGEGENQSLYWIIKEGDQLTFKKLLEGVDRDNILNDLLTLHQELLEEVTNRENDVAEIWGDDKDQVLTGLNSIKKISDALNIEIKKLTKLHDEFNAAIGTTDRDIIEYLKTLPYESLTEIAQVLDNFLNGTSETDTIDTLPELQNFLSGITDNDNLLTLLGDLYNRIQGTPIPSLQYRNLRGIEDKLVSIDVTASSQHANLQEELNTTQTGVGLNQDGSYSPDSTSNYLQSSTSIVNALHILDNLIYTALQEYNLTTTNTGNVILNALKTSNGYSLTGNIKLNSDVTNLLEADENGIFYKAHIDYSLGTLKLYINDKIVDQFNIGARDLVSDAFYDSATENIVIYFKLLDGSIETLRIPVGNLIREWEVDNTGVSDTVILTKTEVYGGGADKLSADVRISTQSDNILQKDNNSLYVSKNTVLEEVSESLLTLKEEVNTAINSAVAIEKNRAETKEDALTELISTEVDRATAEEASIRASITSLLGTFATINATLDNLLERVVALETKTSW